jgi:hypothetical protein
MDAVRKQYFKQLAPFREELAGVKYDLAEELPELAALVRERFPETLPKMVLTDMNQHQALTAVIESIAHDYIAKKVHADAEKRAVLKEAINNMPQFASESGIAELEKRLGKEAIATALQNIGSSVSHIEGLVNAADKRAGSQGAEHRVAERFRNILVPFLGYAQLAQARLKKKG